MRITEIRAVQPMAPDSPPDWRTTFGQILVVVETDAGLTGYGVGGGGAAGIHVVRTVLRDLLLGRDPEPVEDLAADMYQATLPFGRKGLAVMALSGVDLALWDLRGKAANRPIVELLGGRAGQPIPVYTTVWHELTPADTASTFEAFKLHVGRTDTSDPDARSVRVVEIVDTVQRARETIGPERRLMIDAWMQWDVATTLAIAERLAPLDIGWIEEPLSPDDLDGYAELAERSPVRIAGGEHEFMAIGFQPLIDRGLHHVLQPDVCWCGGLTELLKIYDMARSAGLRVCPHRGAEVWALHAIAARDPEPLAESGRPWMGWVGGQSPVVGGKITVGDAPGFGVVIDEHRLQVLCR